MRLGLNTDLRELRPERPPVLLLGGLSLVRALGLAGIPAIVATSEADSPAFASRYCVGCCALPPLESPQAAVDVLLAAGERLADTLGRPVPLFYGSDDALKLITQHRDQLQSHFSLGLNDPEVASALLDKERFEAFARSRGLPLVFDSGPGDDRDLWSFHGYVDERGKLLAWFIGRKLFLELAHDDELGEIGRRVAARVPLKGVFRMDFKKNLQSGEWRLLEINACFNSWHYFAARNGVNLPAVAYAHLVHNARPEAEARYRPRHRWLSMRHPKAQDLFSWSDPGPFVARVRRIPLLSGRLRRWLSTAS